MVCIQWYSTYYVSVVRGSDLLELLKLTVVEDALPVSTAFGEFFVLIGSIVVNSLMVSDRYSKYLSITHFAYTFRYDAHSTPMEDRVFVFLLSLFY